VNHSGPFGYLSRDCCGFLYEHAMLRTPEMASYLTWPHGMSTLLTYYDLSLGQTLQMLAGFDDLGHGCGAFC
jgi:hypothetical protein